MNEFFVSTLMLVTVTALVILSVVVFYLWRISAQLNTQIRSIKGSMNTLANDVAGLCQAGVYQDSRITAQREQLQQIEDKIEAISHQDPPGQSFHAAISAARKGADLKTLVNQFGLTQDEAGLLIRLHGSTAVLTD